MRLVPRGDGAATAGSPAALVQRKPDPAVEAARRQQAAESQRWMDTVMRPDLHDAPDASTQHTSASAVAASPSSTGSGQRLPAAVQARMERAFAADFSGVRVHPESTRPASIGALAYARGNDIYFSPGHYDPGSTSGLELIGHELTHTIQQCAGRVAVQGKGGEIESDPRLEAEADEMGARAARGAAVQMSAPPPPSAARRGSAR